MNLGYIFIAEAVAADVIINRIFQPDERFFWFMIAVQALCLLGWAGSSLPRLAEWPDGTLLAKLTIIQGVFVALIAGNAVYFSCYYLSGYYMANPLPEMACFIMTIAAAWGGDKFLTPLLDRVTSVWTNFFGKS